MNHFAGKDARLGHFGAIMLLHEQITHSLARLKGLDSDVPTTVDWLAEGGPAVAVDFTAVDSLSCGFRELRISADELRNSPFDVLQAWANALCKKVTYLLETIGPLESDAAAQTVLIRSTPPAKQPGTNEQGQTTFYEMLVQSPGTLSLRRYSRAAHEANRSSCDIQITNEVLAKLVQDIVAAIPSAPAAATSC
jgi:hypothetical protein